MKQSIREELQAHLTDLLDDGVLTLENLDDWHFHAFNEDYYIIGYYNAEQWLEKHGVSVFDAVGVVSEYEQDNFDESYTTLSCPESLVNMYVYILGEELLPKVQGDLVRQLEKKVAKL